MILYLDTSALQFVASPQDPRPILPPNFTIGDKPAITIAFLQRTPPPLNTGVPVYQYLDESAAGVIFAIGPAQVLPTAGSFTLTFGANTTPALAFDVDAIALANALNALASITAAGGVTVKGDIGGPFSIAFVAFGVRSLLTAGTNSLFQTSAIAIATAQVGTAALAAVQVVTLTQAAAVSLSSWTAQAAAAISVTSLQGTVIQRVAVPSGTYGGTFTLSINGFTTAAIPWNAQMDVVQSALAAIGISNVTVWPGLNFWDITITGNTFALTGSAAGLVIPLTLTGSLDLTTQQAANLLAGGASAQVPISIQTTAAGAVNTLFSGQTSVSLP